jgi:hypothetical protein
MNQVPTHQKSAYIGTQVHFEIHRKTSIVE